MIRRIFALIIVVFTFSCDEKKDELLVENKVLFTKLNSTQTDIIFINKIENSPEYNIFKYRNFYNGGGVAIGDINNDGLSDVYLTANLGKNQLYLNQGDFKFENITNQANVGGTNTWSTGVVMVDINADRLLDIYVCNAGNVNGDNLKNELFINNGDLTFTDRAAEYNLDENGLTTHASFFDYDKDGDLDLYLLNNSFIPVNSLNYNNKRELRDKDWDVPNILKGGGDKLLRNDNGIFTDVSEEANIFGSLIGFGLGVTVSDINNDTYPDIYVSNDFYERDYLYINNTDGTFTESIKEWTNHLSQSSMGADISDINNDGLLDVFVTDMLPENSKRLKETTQFEDYDVFSRKQNLDFYPQYMQNSLQLNLGNNHFSEIANYGNVAKTDWSWGALVFDMDNDGYKDIFVCNGIYNDLTNQDFMNFFANDIIQKQVLTGKKEKVESIIDKMPSTPILNYAFQNNNDLTFTNVANNWGFDTPSFSNGAAYGDLDNDGDLDLIINNVNQDVFVYKNNSESFNNNNYLQFKLVGSEKNTFGVGSRIQIYSKDETIIQEVFPAKGFQSSIDYVQTIGIGNKTIDSILVSWPDNKQQLITSVTPNKRIVIDYKDAISKSIRNKQFSSPLLKEVNTSFNKHQENVYVDFNYEGLIQKMLSKEGPTFSIADVNKDQRDDVFIGGAKNQEAQLYIQNASGKLELSSIEAFNVDKDFEDTASAFIDVDKDGDLDLIVGSGGNELNEAKNYNTRLYLNNGKGKFTKSQIAIPSTKHNTSVIRPFDFDNDGDKDLFIGSRSVPAVYGINPTHQLLENDGSGVFKDITESKAYDLKTIGMVTDAQWRDVDNDGIKDLVIAREWDAPIILKNSGKRLSNMQSNLDNLKGLWNSFAIKDLNNDGFDDFILGNDGLNLAYKPSKDKPLKLYINDFDDNGTIEQILTETIDGKDIPIITKHELTNQIVSLKKQNLKFSDYATKSIQELFPKEKLDQSIIKEVNITESIVAYGSDSGEYEIKILPAEVQLSSVNAIEILDINNDGKQDLILGGNEYNYKPQYARLDASFGSVLLGTSSDDFEVLKQANSGFFVRGEIKAIKTIQLNNKPHILVVINNEIPKLFKIND
ncbi:VCBS repeat-containing protein [uncultured Winogradskyella sp.]|uniref:VCBS repeat-containing protein n=1 Tax=uncultured Winogradskyella sp. TaxID=395353 RepID=UPI00260FAE96|nr:VCBS repeat-containing protein [uncultured Winogradskyella sp.]